jgi:DNA-directed RNA polymerase subunit RPC12/RpoP
VANGYCVKCKAPREITDPRQITMKNGRPATEGRCPACGTRIFKIGAPDGGAPKAAPSPAGETGEQAED